LEHVQQFLVSNILDRVIHLFFDARSIHIRDNACWVLMNLASVDNDRTGAAAILGARPQMLDLFHEHLLTEGNPHLLGNMLWCLANIAGSGDDFARQILDTDLHTFAGDVVSNPAYNTNLRRNAIFLLRVLSPIMRREEALGVLAQVEMIPPAILLDTNVLSDLMWTIHELFRKTHTIGGLMPAFFVNVLSMTGARFIAPALRTAGDICASDNRDLINRFLGSNLVPAVYCLLGRPAFTRDILWMFSNLAVDPEGASALLEVSGLLFDIGLLAHTYPDAVWTLSNLATRGSKDVVEKLIKAGAPIVLCEVLAEDLSEMERNLCLEGLQGMLLKNPVAVSALIAPHISTFQRHSGTPLADGLLAVLARGGIEAPAALTAEALDAIAPSGAVGVALGRLGLETARNGTTVNIGDLLFTATDIAYMLNRGIVFHRDGAIGIKA
jgi:hypothetical protein